MAECDFFGDGSGSLFLEGSDSIDSCSSVVWDGTYTVDTGHIGNAYSFNGTTDYLSSNTNMNSTSLSFWVSVTNISNPNIMYICELNMSVASDILSIRLYKDSGGSLYLSVGSTSNIDIGYRITNSGFVHIAFVINHATSTFYVYINSIMQYSTSFSYTSIFTSNYFAASGGNYTLEGMLDNIRGFNKMLSEDEIVALYNEIYVGQQSNIFLGSDNVETIMLGSNQVDKIYLGSDIVYST